MNSPGMQLYNQMKRNYGITDTEETQAESLENEAEETVAGSAVTVEE